MKNIIKGLLVVLAVVTCVKVSNNIDDLNNKIITLEEVNNNLVVELNNSKTENKKLMSSIEAAEKENEVLRQEVEEVKQSKEVKQTIVKQEKKVNAISKEVKQDQPTQPQEQEKEEQEEQQSEYTKDDYNNYLEYKNSLIQEHGEEVYQLMNQEAGITTEEESFLHYMEYGI